VSNLQPAWSRVTWEDLTWRSAIPPEALSRSARDRMARPYRASIAPQIADADVRLPRATAAAAEEAAVLVRDFDEEVGGELAPFAAVLLRSESASSSQIENLTSGARQIALAELGEEARRNAVEIVGNVRAMQAAVDLSNTVDERSILAMHRALVERVEPDIAGQWRTEQVWIGGGATPRTRHRSCRPEQSASRVPSMTLWRSLSAATSPSFLTPRSHTPSSRRSTPSSMATGGPGGR